MSTVSDYFKDALRCLGVIRETQTPSAEQGAAMLRVLNGMLDSFRDEGIDIGIEPQTSTTADLFPAEGCRESLKYLLAVRAASEFKVPIPEYVGQFAQSAYDRLIRTAVYANMQTRDFDHLPFANGRRYNIETDN